MTPFVKPHDALGKVMIADCLTLTTASAKPGSNVRGVPVNLSSVTKDGEIYIQAGLLNMNNDAHVCLITLSSHLGDTNTRRADEGFCAEPCFKGVWSEEVCWIGAGPLILHLLPAVATGERNSGAAPPGERN